MLEAAMLGIPYEGTLPRFGVDSAPAVQSPLLPPSPTVLAQRFLREEQDAAFQASLQVPLAGCTSSIMWSLWPYQHVLASLSPAHW